MKVTPAASAACCSVLVASSGPAWPVATDVAAARIAVCTSALSSDSRGSVIEPALVIRSCTGPFCEAGSTTYDALAGLIKGEWWLAPAEMRTAADGTVPVRGFFGDYTAGGVPFAIRPGQAEAAVVVTP